MTQESRKAQIASIKLEIQEFRSKKKVIEEQIADAWKGMANICGHPRARISSWSTSECIDCGYYASTKYFVERFHSVLIDVDGEEVAEKERKAREQRKQVFSSGEEGGK